MHRIEFSTYICTIHNYETVFSECMVTPVMFAAHICPRWDNRIRTNKTNTHKKKEANPNRCLGPKTTRRGTLKIEQLSWRRNRPNALSHPLKSSTPHYTMAMVCNKFNVPLRIFAHKQFILLLYIRIYIYFIYECNVCLQCCIYIYLIWIPILYHYLYTHILLYTYKCRKLCVWK